MSLTNMERYTKLSKTLRLLDIAADNIRDELDEIWKTLTDAEMDQLSKGWKSEYEEMHREDTAGAE